MHVYKNKNTSTNNRQVENGVIFLTRVSVHNFVHTEIQNLKDLETSRVHPITFTSLCASYSKASLTMPFLLVMQQAHLLQLFSVEQGVQVVYLKEHIAPEQQEHL